jgi:hypothetical protein
MDELPGATPLAAGRTTKSDPEGFGAAHNLRVGLDRKIGMREIRTIVTLARHPRRSNQQSTNAKKRNRRRPRKAKGQKKR